MDEAAAQWNDEYQTLTLAEGVRVYDYQDGYTLARVDQPVGWIGGAFPALSMALKEASSGRLPDGMHPWPRRITMNRGTA